MDYYNVLLLNQFPIGSKSHVFGNRLIASRNGAWVEPSGKPQVVLGADADIAAANSSESVNFTTFRREGGTLRGET